MASSYGCFSRANLTLFGIDLSLGILVTFAVMLFYSCPDVPERTDILPSALCVPCDNLLLNPFDEIDLGNLKGNFTKTRNDNNETICCPKTEKDVKVMVDLMTERNWRIAKAMSPISEQDWNCYYNNNQNRRTVALKLVGKTAPYHDQVGKLSTVHWDPEAKGSFSTEGLYYDPDVGKVIVSHHGYYQIFSQITFQRSQRSDSYTEKYSVTHFVFRERYGVKRHILKASESTCVMSATEKNTTTLAGGVFHLRRGDRIIVKTYNPHTIVPSAHANYFGLFRV